MESQQKIPGPWVLIKQSFISYKKYSAQIIPLVLIVGIVGMLQTIATGGGALVTVIAVLLSFIITYLTSIAFVIIAADPGAHGADVWTLYDKAWKIIVPFSWVAGYAVLAFMGSTILLIIPGIIVSIAITFSSYIYVAEGKKDVSALIQSWYYVRGRWWKVFLRMFAMGFVVGFISIIVSLLSFIVRVLIWGVPVMYAANPFVRTNGDMFVSIVNQFASAFLVPISIFFMYNLYTSLKSTKPEITDVERADINGKLKIFIYIGVVVLILAILLSVLSIGISVHGLHR